MKMLFYLIQAVLLLPKVLKRYLKAFIFVQRFWKRLGTHKGQVVDMGLINTIKYSLTNYVKRNHL